VPSRRGGDTERMKLWEAKMWSFRLWTLLWVEEISLAWALLLRMIGINFDINVRRATCITM
jgi:hypothetical protein